jgi:predicted nucleotidyltransferase
MKDTRLNNILNIIIDEYNPTKIILFGSRGKGINLPSSDYDLAVETKKTDFRQKRIVKERIERIIGLHKIDLVFLNEVDKKFRKIILHTGKIIYEQ